MAKISVSLPDELKARLDAYGQEHSQGTSEIVQDALELFLKAGTPVEPPAPPTPPPVPPPGAGGVDQVARNYLLDLAIEVDYMRNSMQASGLWTPQPLPPPPWYNPRSPKVAWPLASEVPAKAAGKKKKSPK